MKLKKWGFLIVFAVCFMFGTSGVFAANNITVKKVEMGTNNPVKGANIIIMKLASEELDNGDVVKTWVSDGTTLTYTPTENGWYIVRETTPAPGYIPAPDQKFYFDGTKDVNFTLESDYTKAEFSAVDASTNKALSGVKMELRKNDGSLVETWVSDGTVHRIDKLPIATYKLKVVEVPKGYGLPAVTEVEITELCATVKLWPVKIPANSKPVPTPTAKPTPSDKETIENVPDTSANASNTMYVLGIMIAALGSGIVYKHAKQN